MRRTTIRLSFGTCFLFAALTAGTAAEWGPGVERWEVKTHPKQGGLSSQPHPVALSDLKKLKWKELSTLDNWKTTEDCLRVQGGDAPQECDIVSTEGYIQLVALEGKKNSHGKRTDGDYHIQVSSSRTNRDDVVIVEVPRPEFVGDADLQTASSSLIVPTRV